jgi:hypothetical protein
MRPNLFKGIEKRDIAAAKTVDRLVGIANGRKTDAIAHQLLQKLFLRRVDVLILIDQNMAIKRADLGADRVIAPQQQHRIAQDIIKINQLFLAQELVKGDGIRIVRLIRQGSFPVRDLAENGLAFGFGPLRPELRGQGFDLILGGDLEIQR